MNIDKGKHSTAVLRIISSKKSVEEISNFLNTEPTRYFLKGQPFSKRNPKSKKREENIWLLESGKNDYEPLEEHLTTLVFYIKSKINFLKEMQLDCEIDIMCSFASENGQGGFTLDNELLKELTKLPIDLIVNLYPPERE